MAKLTWDAEGTRLYETGVDHGVLYTKTGTNGAYETGVAWNGLTGITVSPSGAEANPIYADNIKYLNLYSVEEVGATIEAYTYPDEFMVCDGSAELATGIYVGQQARKAFALCWRTLIGNDVDGTDKGFKIHILYNCMASPSERAYATVNDSPEAMTFSWEVTTTPLVETVGTGSSAVEWKTAYVVIDSTKVSAANMTAIENKLYGTDGSGGSSATLPTLTELKGLISG